MQIKEINQIKLLEVTSKAYKKYKATVKNNENESLETCQKKLTRNVMCGRWLCKNKYKQEVYGYGCLRIFVKNGKIEYIHNHNKSIYIDFQLKKELDKKLGLNKFNLVKALKSVKKRFFKVAKKGGVIVEA